MDPRGLRVIINAYFSLLIHTEQLLSVIFSDTTTGVGSVIRHDVSDGWRKDIRKG